MLTFNSLSRDHWLIGAVDDLATIHDSFNSLSRDHSQFFRQAHFAGTPAGLSTPSLGITLHI